MSTDQTACGGSTEHDYRLLHKAIFWGLMISMVAILATDAALLPFEVIRFGWGGR
jgi:hypothetical protein